MPVELGSSYGPWVRVIIDFDPSTAKPWTGVIHTTVADAEVVGFGAGQRFDGRLDLLRTLEELMTPRAGGDDAID